MTLSLCAAVGLLSAATAAAQECAGYGDLVAISSTNWESGIGAWSPARREVANPSSFDTPNWAVVGSLPGGRAGMAAFVQDVNLGDCANDDESGVLMLDSPTIVLPNVIEVPRINIQHWYETEFGWDGGNFKISVNGGPFALIPASAIESAPYDTELFPEFGEDQLPYSSNPLAGEAAYSGTHDGLPNGSWLQTRINLVGIAGAGDSIRLRLDFGVDCSGGEVGWYVDDVEVFACSDELPPSACGNSEIDAGEQCDDGNDFIGDGCSNTCQVEAGWSCSTPIPGGAIGDPGFESGTPNPAWDESSSNPSGTPICETSVCGTGGGSGPSEGQYWAWFGGVAEAVEDSLTQAVTIPAGLDELTFDLEIPTCDSANDYLEVRLDGQRVFFVNGASARCGDLGYAPQSVAIAAYADGGSHTLQFHAQAFASNGSVSNFFVDRVALPPVGSLCTTQGGDTSLTLIKEVVNDDGGTAKAADWTLQATGPTSFAGSGPMVSSDASLSAGSYNLSESGGPLGYAASAWVCEGGTQVDQDTVTIAVGQAVTCTITNDDFPADSTINAGHAGGWFNPETSGQGVLIDIDPVDQFIFLAWFTYTDKLSALPDEQHWYTAQGNYSGNRADLILHETLGGAFDAPEPVSTEPVGEVTLEFTGCTDLLMSYSIDTELLVGAIPMKRLIPGSENLCAQLAGIQTQAVDINAGMDGAWYEQATAGQGFLIDAYPDPENGNFIFVAWFTYGDETGSGQRWLTAQGEFEGSTTVMEISETTGGSFDDPQVPSTVPVGSMAIDFSDCDNATLSYDLTDESLTGEIPLTRVLANAAGLCEELTE